MSTGTAMLGTSKASTTGGVYSPLEMIEKFISFDTTSRDSNLPLIDFVRAYLEPYQIHCEVIPNATGTKANLLARCGPKQGPGVILSGHTDTVPVDDQSWTHPPFSLTRVGDRLFGRGTVDMKSFVAICVALAPEFSRMKLREPIYLAMSYDEELGCLGVPSMIDKITALKDIPRACIVGEPTEMEVFIAHKGVNVFETTVIGREAHSSQTDSGASAIAAAAELIAFLNKLGREMRERGDPTGVFERDGYTSINVGVISGGTALNIIPKTCKFQWEYRHIPGTDSKEIINRFRARASEVVLPIMRATAPEASIDTRTIIHYGGLRPDPGSTAEALALKCTGKPKSSTTAFGTEAGLFQDAGIPTVVCGPGSIAQAHRPDEFIAADQVEKCTAFLRELARTLT
jgi:acetylornithine deacetylase